MLSGVHRFFVGLAAYCTLHSLAKINANFSDEPTINSSVNFSEMIFHDLTITTTPLTNTNSAEFMNAENALSNKHHDNMQNDSVKSRKATPVKLTMKQGLIMNQVITTYALADVKNALCKNHTEEFKIGLRALEPWALQMFDSSSKVASGILNGNLVEYGAYRQCLNIYKDTEYGPIRGRHCGFRITPNQKLLMTILSFRNVSERTKTKQTKTCDHCLAGGQRVPYWPIRKGWLVYTPAEILQDHIQSRYNILKNHVMDDIRLIWSVCVPDSCQVEDIFPHFNRSISELTEGLNFTIDLKDEHCQSLNGEPVLSMADYIFIIFIGLIMMIVGVATTIDLFNRGKQQNWEKSRIVSAFSAYSNGKYLFATDSTPGELECLHGLRYISICYVVAGHRFMQNMIYPNANSVDLIYWIHTYFSTLITGGTVSVDTFFLLSSTLVSYNFFVHVKKNNSFNLFFFYLYRNIRITFSLAMTVAIYGTILKHFGSGPTWYDYSYAFQKPCQTFWWTTLLNIQNYVNPQALCIIPTWYLTDDMIFYYLSPIILVPLWKCPCFGLINWVAIFILSIIISFVVAWDNEFDGGMPITRQLLDSRYFQRHYVAAHTRAPPYIIGLAFGYMLFRIRDQRGRGIRINPIIALSGWMLTGFFLTSVVLAAHVFHLETYEYNRWWSSLFLACSRSLWTVGVAWIIFCCVNGQGGVINGILSWKVFKVLGRLAYGILLLHYGFQAGMQASRKTPDYFSNFTSIYMSCADVVLMSLLAIPFALCFEYPSTRLASLLVNRANKKNDSRVKPIVKENV